MIKTQQFIKEFKKLGKEERAVFEKKYQKSTREHFGVAHGDMQKLINSYAKEMSKEELLELSEELWKSENFDLMTAATKVLKNKKIEKDKKLWKLGKGWMKDCDGWALADGLSLSMREVLVFYPELLDELEKWTTHKNMWFRRATLVFTLPYSKSGMNPERMLDWASKYSKDSEWFIQKAIGWWLRDLGKHNPDRVIKFLNSHWDDLKSVARKESTRLLSSKSLVKIKALQSPR
jgi:3-methyladenine DNA glycosylase AlkD